MATAVVWMEKQYDSLKVRGKERLPCRSFEVIADSVGEKKPRVLVAHERVRLVREGGGMIDNLDGPVVTPTDLIRRAFPKKASLLGILRVTRTIPFVGQFGHSVAAMWAASDPMRFLLAPTRDTAKLELLGVATHANNGAHDVREVGGIEDGTVWVDCVGSRRTRGGVLLSEGH